MTIYKKTANVWDPLVRIGHWILVVAFFTAYLTEDDFLTQHVWAGYVVGVYVLVRILWGFVGTQHARFRNFVYSPAQVIDYLKNLVALRPQHYIGHNPAGGAMVLALLVGLTGTTITGLKLYAVEEHQGPFALAAQKISVPTMSVNPLATAKAETADDDEESEGKESERDTDEQAEDFWEEAHEIFANLTLMLVLIHIAGVIASSVVDKANLVKTMVTGKKEIDDSYR